MWKKLERNDMCWCGSNLKYKKCHYRLDERMLELESKGYMIPSRELIKSKEQIAGIRESGKINVAILDNISDNIREGITTQQIDEWVHQMTIELGGIPAPLNYEGYPKSVCTSVNEEVCHGIPASNIVLRDGDIVNVDVSTVYKGYYSDSSRMFCIGTVSDEKKQLVEAARIGMELGIQQVRPWGFIGDIGQVINSYAKKRGYSVVREVGGHGIGMEFHEEPFVNHTAKKGTGMVMVPGMVFTIEPMVNMGKSKVIVDSGNGWTVKTADKKPSAQWESQVLVTEEGYEILAY